MRGACRCGSTRVTANERRAQDLADEAEHMQYRKSKEKTNSQTQLEVYA